jgi:hypothetical protein
VKDLPVFRYKDGHNVGETEKERSYEYNSEKGDEQGSKAYKGKEKGSEGACREKSCVGHLTMPA